MDNFELTPRSQGRLESDFRLLLVLRNVGAEPLLIFRQKPRVCRQHWPERIAELGLQPVQARALSLVPRVADESKLDVKNCNCGRRGCIEYSLVHPFFEHTVWGSCLVEGGDSQRIQLAVAGAAIRKYFDGLVSDVWASRFYGSSLGLTLETHRMFLAGEAADVDSLALQLDLPIVEGIPFETAFRLRQEEGDHFERFRYALRTALRERANNNSFESGSKVVEEINCDVVQPALRSIRDRLRASERTLSKKTATNVTLGSLVTVCGILAGVAPALAIGAGVSTLATASAAAAAKHLEEKRELELSDFYFLWKAAQHGQHGDRL